MFIILSRLSEYIFYSLPVLTLLVAITFLILTIFFRKKRSLFTLFLIPTLIFFTIFTVMLVLVIMILCLYIAVIIGM